MVETLKQEWEGIKNAINEKMETLKANLKEKWESIKSDLATKWAEIKKNAEEHFDKIVAKIVEIWTSLKEKIKTPINGFLSIIESGINKIIGGVNKLIDALNSIPDIQFTNPFTGTQYKLGINVPKLSTVTIPKLAQGAVIPPNKEFMAVLGDQKSGTNIEAPLDTIKQAVAEELAAQISVLEEGFADVVNAINRKELAIGDKEIGRANARYTAQQKLIRGTSI